MGGEVSVDSEVGKGTTFTISMTTFCKLKELNSSVSQLRESASTSQILEDDIKKEELKSYFFRCQSLLSSEKMSSVSRMSPVVQNRKKDSKKVFTLHQINSSSEIDPESLKIDESSNSLQLDLATPEFIQDKGMSRISKRKHPQRSRSHYIHSDSREKNLNELKQSLEAMQILEKIKDLEKQKKLALE